MKKKRRAYGSQNTESLGKNGCSRWGCDWIRTQVLKAHYDGALCRFLKRRASFEGVQEVD